MKKRLGIGIVVAAAAMLCACPKRSSGPGHARENTREQDAIVKLRTETLDNASKKREERLTKLKAMDVAQLAGELAADSEKGREPFNSTAFAEAVRRGEPAAPALAQTITPDRKSLLTLLALRKSRGVYQQLPPAVRVAILIDALRNSRNFNAWGMPHLKWEEAAQAIIDEGQAAEKPLTDLLNDSREAPVWGGEYHSEYVRYKYRVRDYAWALLAAIRNQKVDVPVDPAARDALIARMRGETAPQ